MKHKLNLVNWGTILSLLVVSFALLTWLPVTPTRADGELPPRETPTPSPPEKDKDKAASPVGAYIELVGSDVPAGAWVGVQWQDSTGGWQDVQGWQGVIATSNHWWVHPKDFGTGPFRWLVRQGPNGPVIGESEPFSLPGEANQTVQIQVSGTQ